MDAAFESFESAVSRLLKRESGEREKNMVGTGIWIVVSTLDVNIELNK